MHKLSATLLTAVVLATGSFAGPSGPFSIRISTDKTEVKASSDIIIKIQLTNTSTRTVDCTKVPSNGADTAYQYDVRDLGGNAVPKVARDHPEIAPPFQIWPCVLRPKESTSIDGNVITRMYDMSRPGKYLISVSRFIDGDRKDAGSIKSNVIMVTVAP